MKRTVATILLGVLLLTILPIRTEAVQNIGWSSCIPSGNGTATATVTLPHVTLLQTLGGKTWITADSATVGVEVKAKVTDSGELTYSRDESGDGVWRVWDITTDNLGELRQKTWAAVASRQLLEIGYYAYAPQTKQTFSELVKGANVKYLEGAKIYNYNPGEDISNSKTLTPALVKFNKENIANMLKLAYFSTDLVESDKKYPDPVFDVRDEEAFVAAQVIYFWLNGMNYNTGVEGLKAYAKDALTEHLGTDASMQQENRNQAVAASLGDFPANGSFYECALWSAQYYTLQRRMGVEAPSMDNYITRDAADVAGVGTDANTQYPTDIQKVFVQSLFRVVDIKPTDFNHDPVETGWSSDMPTDALLAANSLKEYLALNHAGGLGTVEDKMLNYPKKLEVTMALASGMLAANDDDSGTGVTDDEIKEFIETAYGDSLYEIDSLMYADVGRPVSKHLGPDVDTTYYYYLVLCYQEFGAYATNLLDELGPVITADNTSFTSFKEQLKMLKGLAEVLTWADDDSLWEYWNIDNKRLVNADNDFKSLKALYDYLTSVNAFDGVDSYDPEATTSAFAYFFSEENGFQLSEQMRTGLVASATFLPMRTSVYDPYSFDGITTTDWLVNYHAKFGYNRKALYRDTTVDAAVNLQRTKSRGRLEVCTLKDLLNPDQDIVLYIDDNLYNVNKLAEMTDKAFERLDNVDAASSNNNIVGKLWESAKGAWEINMENVAKTAEVTTYSQEVQKGGIISTVFTSWDEFFMPLETAKEELSPDTVWDDTTQSVTSTTGYTYGPMQPYAVLSGVYQDESLFRSLNAALIGSNPVFVSSPTVPYLEEASSKERSQIFNYLLLKNMDSQMTIDYATNLDLTSPIYMDVYGNIVTESGIVIIPAAANATLYNSSYRPYNAAFYSTYGDDFLLPYDADAESLNKLLEEVLTPVDGVWQLASLQVKGGSVDLSRLSTADKESLAEITEIFAYDVGTSGFCNASLWKVIITEVLRGAPIECIDKDFEGLNTTSRITRSGLMVANKLDELIEALSSDGANASLSIPNPAYIEGLEYVVFFAFKILILITLVIWMTTIYVDAAGGSLGLRTGGKCIGAILLTLSLIVGVPTIFELSYYESNKLLLQDETELLMMLNLEKSESGNEIGITKVSEPEKNTTLYLRLADVEMPWWDLLPKIMVSSMDSNLEKLYEEYENAHPIANSPSVTVKNGTVYISTEQLFESSAITFSSVSKTIYQQAAGDTPASYYTPYYVFLDQLIYKANAYAAENDYYAYSTKIQKGGRLKTLGFIQPYFTSEEFVAEGMDYLGLYTIYDVTAPAQYFEMKYTEDVLEAIRNSQWCNRGLSDDECITRIEKLNVFAQKWVAEHKEMIGKVTDETFLKTMALACALEHNRLFNTMRADYLEIQELGNEDLLRLSIADKDTVMRNSSMSFARFVYTVGGTPAVYAAAILTLVNFLSSWVKPLVTLIVFIITCISIFVFKLILRKDNKSVFGYITTIFLMCVVNVLGALFLKLTMYIPVTGLSPTVCILVQVVIQSIYLFALVKLVLIAVKDWRNVGFQKYSTKFNTIIHNKEHSIDVETPAAQNGWEYYNKLVERQRRRHRSL